MVRVKTLQNIFWLAFLPLAFFNDHAQKAEQQFYQHKMLLMDSLSIYKITDYDTLYHFSVLSDDGNKFTQDYYGWVKTRGKKTISLISTDGTELEVDYGHLTQINSLAINDTTVTFLIKTFNDIDYRYDHLGKYYLFTLWLYRKGKTEYSRQTQPKLDKYFSDDRIRDDFGIVYYDAMLSAFSRERNYTKAIKLGNHLSRNIFKGYKYQTDANKLTDQLKKCPEDFKAFHNPDSLEWVELKKKLTRHDQILYLANRLRLLNCVQLSQPGNISYSMYQFSIPYTTANKIGNTYWGFNSRYHVINPYTALFEMKLNPQEIELLLPYLLADDYIASYSNFRDFYPERTLHKVSWVTHSLLYAITNQHFFNQQSFDSLSIDGKKAEVKKIKQWCDDNPTARSLSTLN